MSVSIGASATIDIPGGRDLVLERESRRDRDDALSAMFLDHYDRLRRLAFVMLGEGPLAEEIVMEAFAKATSRWHLVSRADNPGAYLRQIVVNLCRSKIRRKVLERKVTDMFKGRPEEVADLSAEGYGMDIDIWRAVQKLPDRQRTCIVLRYLEDMSEPEVAETLDCPVGTVKSQLSRARQRLADMLGPGVLS